MAYSRFSRYEERKARVRLAIALLGILAVILFLVFFGVKLLVQFSLLVDRLRGSSPQTTSKSIILAPVLDPLPQATNSASLIVTGRGSPGLTLILYLNETELKKKKLEEDGTFSIPVDAQNGNNIISAKLIDDKNNASDLSNVISTFVSQSPPVLEVNSPEGDVEVTGDQNTIIISGKTESDNSMTINGRLVVVKADGAFTSIQTLSEGDNIYSIVATNQAGNRTTVERRVTYRK